MITRRMVLGAASAATLMREARSQPRELPIVGIVAPERPPFAAYDAFLDGLRSHGQVEGATFAQETRWAEGQRLDLHRQFAKELDGLAVRILVTGDTPATIAAHEVTKSTPIVMAFLGAGDPVELGLARSIARPGGNVTGSGAVRDPSVPFSEVSRRSAPGERHRLLAEALVMAWIRPARARG
jgi:putative ABC transport system substrate-binding protein